MALLSVFVESLHSFNILMQSCPASFDQPFGYLQWCFNCPVTQENPLHRDTRRGNGKSLYSPPAIQGQLQTILVTHRSAHFPIDNADSVPVTAPPIDPPADCELSDPR